MPRLRERLPSLLVFLGLFALCVTVQRGVIATYDGKIVYAVARSLTHGGLRVDPAVDFFGMHTPYSSYGIGISLVIAPLYRLQTALGFRTDVLVTLANPIVVAAAGTVVFRCGVRMGWSARAAVLAGLALGWLTMLLQASNDLFSEPGVALGVAMLILGLLRWRDADPRGGLIAGAGIGVAVLFRSDSLLLVLPAVLLLPWLLPRPALSDRRALVGLAVGVLPALVWTSAYSLLRSGSLVPKQYGGSFSTPLPTGLHGLLLSPGKAFFLYNPVLLLALVGVVRLWRRDRLFVVLLVGLFAVRVLFFARWSAWEGGVSWGPRFLAPGVVPMLLLAGEAVRGAPALRRGARVVALGAVGVLVAAGAVVNLASVWVPFEASYRAAVNVAGVPVQLRPQAVRGGFDRYIDTVDASPLGYDLPRLGDPPAMRHWRGGPSPVGVGSAAVAVLSAAGALGTAGSRRPSGPGPGRRPAPSPDAQIVGTRPFSAASTSAAWSRAVWSAYVTAKSVIAASTRSFAPR